MKNLLIATLAAVCLYGLLTTAVPAQNDAPRGANDAPIRWQHMAMTIDVTDGKPDAKLGRQIHKVQNEGWELVDVESINNSGTTEKTVFYFKKPQ